LIANETADLVSNQAVMVTVEGPDGMQVAEKFNLTVKQ
jgi:hypothetical protein